MLQLSVSFYVSPETDHAALSEVLAQLAALTGGRVQVASTPVPAPVPQERTAAVVAAAEVAAPSAPVLPGPGSAEQPKRGRGRPRKDGQPPAQSAPATTAVQGVAAEASHVVTPPPATPAPATKVAAAKSNAELEAELFGDSKAAPAATLEQLQVAMRASVESRGAAATKDIFLQAGYANLSAVPAEAYGTMVAKLRV